MNHDLIIIGGGPGGYVCAIRAAQLGLNVAIIEVEDRLGGTCARVGCIPSKALLHAAKVLSESREMAEHAGLNFTRPEIDLDKLRGWKEGVVKRLTGGLAGLARQRKVTVVAGVGRFVAPNLLAVEGADGARATVSFDQAIIACGSEPVTLPFVPHQDPRVVDSTGYVR